MHYKKGFTILELMAVLFISGLLVSVGAPKMFSMIEDERVSADVQSFVQTFNQAKNIAISERKTIYMLSNNFKSDWDSGWSIFESFPSSSTVVSVDKKSRASIKTSRDIKNFAFNYRGTVKTNYVSNLVSETVTFCGESKRGVRVYISGLGRIKTEDIEC